MARIRTIKPEFFLDERLATLSPAHRLLFAGLWTLADRDGRLEDSPLRIKAQLFPYEEMPVDEMLADLDALGPVHRYEVDGRACIAIPAFRKHQRPHPKEVPTDLPGPPSREKTRPAVFRFSSIPSSPAGKGREGKESWEGKGRSFGKGSGETLFAPAPPPPPKASTSKPEKPPNPRHAPMVARLTAAFQTKTGLSYGFTGRDAKSIADLLALTPDDALIETRWIRALGSTGFPVVRSLAELATHWNHFATEPPPTRPRGAATDADKDWSKPVKTIETQYGRELDIGQLL